MFHDTIDESFLSIWETAAPATTWLFSDKRRGRKKAHFGFAFNWILASRLQVSMCQHIYALNSSVSPAIKIFHLFQFNSNSFPFFYIIIQKANKPV